MNWSAHQRRQAAQPEPATLCELCGLHGHPATRCVMPICRVFTAGRFADVCAGCGWSAEMHGQGAA